MAPECLRGSRIFAVAFSGASRRGRRMLGASETRNESGAGDVVQKGVVNRVGGQLCALYPSLFFLFPCSCGQVYTSMHSAAL